MARVSRSAVIDLRVSEEEKTLIREAAGASGQTITEFIKAATLPMARAVVEEQQVIRLSASAWEEFWDRLNTPAQPTELARREAADFMKKWAEADNL